MEKIAFLLALKKYRIDLQDGGRYKDIDEILADADWILGFIIRRRNDQEQEGLQD